MVEAELVSTAPPPVIIKSLFDIPGCRFHDTGLILDPDLSYSHWEAIGAALTKAQKSVQWWIGDWVAFGERKYGEPYAQALSRLTGYEEQTVRNAVFTATHVEPERRDPEVPFAIYSEVASLPAPEQDDFVTTYKKGDISKNKLRLKINVHKAEKVAVERDEFFDKDFEESKLEWRTLKKSIQVFINRFPRFLYSGEIFIGDVDEDFETGEQEPMENVVAKVERGAKSWDGLAQATGYTEITVRALVKKLCDAKRLKVVPKGGKTEVARGAVEDVIAKYNDPVGIDYRYQNVKKDDDEDDDE